MLRNRPKRPDVFLHLAAQPVHLFAVGFRRTGRRPVCGRAVVAGGELLA